MYDSFVEIIESEMLSLIYFTTSINVYGKDLNIKAMNIAK